MKSILKCLWGIESYIYIKCLRALLTHVYWEGDRGIHLRLQATKQSSSFQPYFIQSIYIDIFGTIYFSEKLMWWL